MSLILLAAVLASSQAANLDVPTPPAETRVVEYLKANVKPGQPVVVSELYNSVFTGSEERAALNRLFNTFFKIPLFLAQHQKAAGKPPTLAEISEQFRFGVPGQADVMLRIMESDPRMPKFVARDPATGEVTRVDVDAILAHPRFGKRLERTITGLEGWPAPALSVPGYDGRMVTSAALAGRPYLVYFWFTGCPPCVKTAPLLVALHKEFGPRGLEVVALNADRLLEVGTSDEERAADAKKKGMTFTLAHATAEAQEAYGATSVYPTMFFVDRKGTIVRQFVNFQDLPVLEEAARLTLR